MSAEELNERTLAKLAEATGGTVETKPEGDTTVVTDATVDPNKPAEETAGPDTLEFKPGEPETTVTPEVKPDVSKDESTTDQNAEVDTKLKEAGFDVDALSKELVETGKISDAAIADLKTKLDPALVDAHLQRLTVEVELAKLKGQTTIDDGNKKIEDMNAYIYDSVGGIDNFTAMAKALAKAPKADQESIDAKLQSGNKLLVAEGMKAAVAAYNKIKGMGGKLMSGDAGNGVTQEALPKVTKAEFRVITASEKYKTDKTYAEKMDLARMATAKADKVAYGPGQYYGFTNGQRYEL